MLPQPEKMRGFLAEAAIQALVAWALLSPLLRLLFLSHLATWALLVLVPFSLLFALTHRLPRKGILIVWAIGFGSFGAWLTTGVRLRATVAVAAGLIIGSGGSAAVLLYADIVLPVVVLGTLLYARLLILGEPVFSVPMLLSTVLMMWFSGARHGIADFIPAVLAAPLLFVYTASPEEIPALPADRPKSRGLLRALPVALAIILVAVGLTPANRVTNPALEHQADRLRQLLNDHFFFTQARKSFFISALGYQPLGDRGLGGKPQISHAMVMEVDTPRQGVPAGHGAGPVQRAKVA